MYSRNYALGTPWLDKCLKGLFFNTLTVDQKYSLLNRDNFR